MHRLRHPAGAGGPDGPGAGPGLGRVSVGFVLGIPLATALGNAAGWRAAFAALAGVMLVVVVLVALVLPDLPDLPATESPDRPAPGRRRRLTAVVSSNAVAFVGYFALYTYVSSLLLRSGADERVVALAGPQPRAGQPAHPGSGRGRRMSAQALSDFYRAAYPAADGWRELRVDRSGQALCLAARRSGKSEVVEVYPYRGARVEQRPGRYLVVVSQFAGTDWADDPFVCGWAFAWVPDDLFALPQLDRP